MCNNLPDTIEELRRCYRNAVAEYESLDPFTCDYMDDARDNVIRLRKLVEQWERTGKRPTNGR